jgi:phosphoribosylglycinamide formyltransferase-1
VSEPRTQVGVLVSGSGTNLQALIDAAAQPDYPAKIAVVVSNVPGVTALERARACGIPAVVVEHRSFASREAFDQQLAQVLGDHSVEIVCLAGFMRLLSPSFVRAFPRRVLNIHPALLPAFPGLHGPRQALAYGAKIAGCTVHFVDEGLDSGPIIVQAAVPVLATDDEAALSARILAQEHRIYPLALRWLAGGHLRVDGRTVKLQPEATPDGGPLIAM